MILLDTHVWLWWVSSPEMLPPKAKLVLDKAMKDKNIFISSISVWEIALLVEKGRLTLSMNVQDWIAKSERLPFINFVPIDNAIAMKSVLLSKPFYNDPADRIIIATAIILGIPIVTKDLRIINFSDVQTIWE
ncbi:type II toxin-antitoxin system VapC family toxin [bacterium]|nr:type II toxin-antitoxin system VapC family toxin [bacterium]